MLKTLWWCSLISAIVVCAQKSGSVEIGDDHALGLLLPKAVKDSSAFFYPAPPAPAAPAAAAVAVPRAATASTPTSPDTTQAELVSSSSPATDAPPNAPTHNSPSSLPPTSTPIQDSTSGATESVTVASFVDKEPSSEPPAGNPSSNNGVSFNNNSSPEPFSQEMMLDILKKYNTLATKECNAVTAASWNAATDVGNKEKEAKKIVAIGKRAAFIKEWYEAQWKDANMSLYKDRYVKRQLYFLKQLGQAVLPPTKLDFLTGTISSMTTNYNTATVCPYSNQLCESNDTNRLALDPEISNRFAISRDYDELKYLWVSWHNESGRKIRSAYTDYVGMMNEVAKGNGFNDAAEYWKNDFEDPDFEQHIDDLWLKVKSLYDELHTYMRYKLLGIYGIKMNRSEQNIPAHLLGNMWAQSWDNLYEDTKPYKRGAAMDVTQKMKELNYDAFKMFEIANDFYMSMGLPSNKMSYTGKSVIIKPANVTIQCHASAWDFCDAKDFRIKMCTYVNQEDLITIHHEMGHIQYYIQYKDQPDTFHRGANPGFHEAIGDTIALSTANPYHLSKIGLIDQFTSMHENDINGLYMEALKRIAFLPFGLLIDKWRWNVFSGKTPNARWNEEWWALRKQYQKVIPPVERSEMDFDPGAKFHVPANSKYISYFISHILEFQFYRALCIEAGQFNPKDPTIPLHRCDFYNSTDAGKKLAAGLKVGASQHWSEVLEIITGEKEISADAILEYFKPLREVLAKEIEKMRKEDIVRQKLEKYNTEYLPYCQTLRSADWNRTTDLDDPQKEEIYVKAVAANAAFVKNSYESAFRVYTNETFPDEKINRQIRFMGDLGTNALNESKVSEFTGYVNEMIKIYNSVTFCPFKNQNCTEDQRMSLDPEITKVMATSTDAAELQYTWEKWHNETGLKMKSVFKSYIELNNEAAKLNGYHDAGEMWRAKYEDPNLVDNLNAIWKKVEPLYLQLHTYTKNKLNKLYGDKIVDPKNENIPGHLLGNMWAQTWENLYERIKPFNGSDFDITAALQRKNYTAFRIFQEANRFYQNLSLPSNEMSYTGQSIIEKPKDRLIVCHASAWDMCDGKDFRIKQCTVADQKNFITAHHEMGHIQYYILYKDQPLIFREGANPGFHEAIGDVMALSVSTPNHLHKIYLLDEFKDSREDNLNSLFKMALDRIAFLPFGLLIDVYRWDLFAGNVKNNEWNMHWENLRRKYQRVDSPVPRDRIHFDAGAKFHVSSNYPYVAYFVSHILEFQIFRSLCIEAKQYDPKNSTLKPLHKCDIDGSAAAGQRLRDGLSLGNSKHWTEVLRVITNGETELSANAILEYFQPLQEFLEEANNPSIGKGDKSTKLPWILGGFILLVAVVALIAYAIYYYNRK
ncbi:angiotensin-converting enzyme-like isoform X1 [Sitodiplosis mosellana]|nr:angiotensin-converting enzyme-like isoform X1 [Sitodiplosis mosellana]